MLRDKSLIPLSHQHQRALALCVRIDRAQPISGADLNAWQVEIEQLAAQEIKIHFAAEERIIFPLARRFPELVPVVDDLERDHARLREYFSEAEARRMSAGSLLSFAQDLAAHIRKEERQLFEGMQRVMSAQELQSIGAQLEEALKDATQVCIVPNETTKLRRLK